MDTDKDKPLPEKSSSFTAREGNDNNGDNQQQQHPQDVDRQDPSNQNKESEKEAETPKHAEPDEAAVADPDHPDPPPPAADAEKELQESEINEPTQATVEEPTPSPPDLDKVSQDIDQYISSLSSSSLNSSSATEAAPEDGTPKPQEDVPIFVEQFAVLVDAKIENYDSRDNPVKWPSLTEEDSAAFLEAVDRVSKLYKSLCEYSSSYKYAYSINRVGSVLQRAMAYMEHEFRSLLEDCKTSDSDATTQDSSSSKPTANSLSATNSNVNQQRQYHEGSGGGGEEPPPPAPENDPPPPDNIAAGDSPGIGIRYSDETLSSLSKLSKAMIQGGYETECCQVYFVDRRNAMEETLHTFGFEKHSIDDVQKMNWESLEREIQAWISTLEQCTATELPRERKLSDSVFSHHRFISEALFCSLSRGVIVQLINFLEAVAMTKRAAEKLFKLMDVYETLRDVLPMLDGLIPSESVKEIKSEAMLTRCRLGEVIICIFCELENSIKADTGKTTVPGGAVHPLTRYTINYLKYACEYKDTLEQVFREHQKIERADSGAGSDFDCNAASAQQKLSQSPFQAQLGKTMELLDANLEAKSKLYRDLSLSSVFLMNNGRYILQKIRGSPELNNLMGDAWCRKRSSDLRQYHKNYQRETWGKLLNFLINHEGLSVNGKVVKPVVKERLKSFNALFDEIHRTQSSWVISDDQLQSELRVSISNMVIPAYRSFLARYGQILTPGRQSEKYVKYQPEDIETYVDELFDGNATPTGKRRS